MTTPRDRQTRGGASAARRAPVRDRRSRGEALSDSFPNPPEATQDGPAGPTVPRDGAVEPESILPDDANRMQNIATSTESYAREYTLRFVHQKLLQNVGITDIAAELECSINHVANLRRELFRRLKREAGNVDMLTHAGRTLSFYDEVRGQGLKLAADVGAGVSNRIRALAASLQAEKDKHVFLHRAGFYDQVKFSPRSGADDPTADEALSLADIAKAMLDPNASMQTIDALAQTEDVADAMFGLGDEDDDVSLL